MCNKEVSVSPNKSEITALLVDDEPSNIDLLKSLLADKFKIKAATNGKLAVKIASKALPDIIFLDVLMPEQSGSETAQQIRALPNGDKVKVVYVSGSELPPEVKVEDGFILKPLNQDKVDSLLNKIIIN